MCVKSVCEFGFAKGLFLKRLLLMNVIVVTSEFGLEGRPLVNVLLGGRDFWRKCGESGLFEMNHSTTLQWGMLHTALFTCMGLH